MYELLQNSWDQNVRTVDVRLEKPSGSRLVHVMVEDDDPDGFSDLSHAFTLFAESGKKGDPTKRGRFNLGEKLVLALCEEATIETTKGTVSFEAAGRRHSRKRRQAGSRFTGSLRMTVEEFEELLASVDRLLVPRGIVTRVNGQVIEAREPIAEFQAVLPTDISDSEGFLKRRPRKTVVRVFDPLDGEEATLFEMGVPVVVTEDRFHVDVQQKVPLSIERDNVPPSYLRSIRTEVLNHTYSLVTEEDANDAWVREALADCRCNDEAVKHAVTARFGSKAVAYDPSDPEANKLAVSKGYTVVHGGHLSAGEWNNVRSAGTLAPAGQVTPSPKAFSDDPNAPPVRLRPPEQWSAAERQRVEDIRDIAHVLIDTAITVRLADDRSWKFLAAYGEGDLILNRRRLGAAWFAGPLREDVLAVVLHELGHHYSSDHLSAAYHDALSRLGARLALYFAQEESVVRTAEAASLG